MSAEEAWAIDGYAAQAEVQRARLESMDLPWEVLPEDDDCAAKFRTIFYYLDPNGFRYYLPACMIWILSRWGGESADVLDHLIYALTLKASGEATTLDDSLASSLEYISIKKMANFSTLTPDQREAVRCFLHFVNENAPEADAKLALSQYWESAD